MTSSDFSPKIAISGKSSVACYNDHGQEFSVSMKVSSPRQFRLIQTKITVGEYAGMMATVYAPVEAPFGLMRLPAEIRLIIFEIVLKQSGVRFRRWADPSLKTDDTFWEWNPKGREARQDHLAALLTINRALYTETFPLLYTCNIFHFCDYNELYEWLTILGPHREHVRSIELWWTAQLPRARSSCAEGLCPLLNECKKLSRLQLALSSSGRRLSTHEQTHSVFGDLKAFLMPERASWEICKERHAVIDFLCIGEGLARQLNAKLKELLLKYMEMEKIFQMIDDGVSGLPEFATVTCERKPRE